MLTFAMLISVVHDQSALRGIENRVSHIHLRVAPVQGLRQADINSEKGFLYNYVALAL